MQMSKKKVAREMMGKVMIAALIASPGILHLIRLFLVGLMTHLGDGINCGCLADMGWHHFWQRGFLVQWW
jgi:hypothetical protein